MRLPRKIDLGLAVVSVRLVTKAEMKIAVDDDDDEGLPDGFWDPDSDSILVGKWLSPKQKREVYYHELLHVINDSAYFSQH